MPVQLPPVDDDVYAALQARAVPLEDDINSVLRRLLGLTEDRSTAPGNVQVEPASRRQKQGPKARHGGASTKKRKRVPKGLILPEEAYELPILRALDELGGRVPTREVIDRIGVELEPRLTEMDRAELGSGEIRWRNRAQFVRMALIEKGHMADGSPRGIWEISDAGRGRLAEGG